MNPSVSAGAAMEVIHTLCTVIQGQGVALDAGAASHTAGAEQDADWLCVQGPLVAGTLLMVNRLQSCQPSLTWAAPFANHNIVRNAGLLLRRVIRSHRAFTHLQVTGRLSGSARAALTQGSEPLHATAQLLCRLGDVLTWAKRVAFRAPGVELLFLPPPDAARSLRILSEQLRSRETLEALAEGVRWAVTVLLQPQEATGAGRRQPRGAAVAAAQTRPDGADMSALATAALCVVQLAADTVDALLNVPVAPSHGAPRAAGPSYPSAITAPQRLQLLRDLHSTGLFAAVFDAALRVMQSAPVSDDGIGGERNTAYRVSACLQPLRALWRLADTSLGAQGSSANYFAAVDALLLLPEVSRLRLAALEQLAASAPPVGWSPPPLSGGGAAAAATPSSADSRTGPGAVTWPIFRAEALQACRGVGLTVDLSSVHTTIAEGLIVPFRRETHAPGAGGQNPSQHEEGQPEKVRRVARQMPTPSRLMGLAAAACRAMAAALQEQRQTVAGGAAAAGYNGGAGSGDTAASSTSHGVTSSAGGATDGIAWRRDTSSVAILNVALLAVDFMETAGEDAEQAAALPDVLETVGWWLWALAEAGTEGGVTPDRSAVADATGAAARWTLRFKTASPAVQAETLHRLLPTRLFAALDCLLRREAAGWMQDPEQLVEVTTGAQRAISDLLGALVGARLKQQQEPPSSPVPTASGSAGMSSHSGGSSGASVRFSPQDDLGLIVTLAKLARRGTAAATAALSGSAFSPLSPAAPWVVLMAAEACDSACGLLVDLLVTAQQQSARGARRTAHSSSDTEEQRAARQRSCTALREACALTIRATMPLLEALLSDGAPPDWRRDRLKTGPFIGALADGVDLTPRCIRAASMCVRAAAAVLPAEEFLALAPQRLLALVTRRLQERVRAEQGAAGRRAGRRAGGRSRGGGTRRDRSSSTPGGPIGEDYSWPDAACWFDLTLAFLAAHGGLVGSVAGWLRGGDNAPAAAAAAGQQQKQQQLDVEALAAMAQHWDITLCSVGLHEVVTRLPLARSGPGGSNSTSSNTTSTDNSSLRSLVDVARTWCTSTGIHAKMLPEGSVAGGVASTFEPLWPPCVLRVCCNLRCDNFAGPAEAALKLKLCGGCKAVRYCRPECQRHDWREGGHKEQCPKLKRETEGEEAG